MLHFDGLWDNKGANHCVKKLRAEVHRALDRMPWYVPDFAIDEVHRKTNELTRTADIGIAAFATGSASP